MPATTKLWGGRFTGATDPLMTAFNESLPYDRALHTADIIGSKAYAQAIHKSGIISSHECSELLRGLDLVENEWLDGKFQPQENDEDIHTANERRLGEIIGTKVAGKLHTGRSRNDQVATDMRIWTREEGRKLVAILKELIDVMITRAEKEIDVLMPGYTHLQRAQPIRWGHFLCAYATFLSQDLQRLTQLLSRVNLLPLGSGALAGNPFNVDRQFLASELGFEGIIENSLVAVSDRDFVTEFLFWSSLTSQHLSRLAEDLIIYGTAEFGFVQLADAYSYFPPKTVPNVSTGSSLMPQKKNSDSLELLRGKSGRLFGHLAGFMMTVKGLPSTYNKDLQESQEPLFDTMSQINACLQITTGVISTLTIHPEKMRKALGAEMLATDLADYLVRKGVPFRETHHISGQAVALAERKDCGIDELSVEDFKGLSQAFEADVKKVFDFEASVEARSARGGAAKQSVLDQVEKMREALKSS